MIERINLNWVNQILPGGNDRKNAVQEKPYQAVKGFAGDNIIISCKKSNMENIFASKTTLDPTGIDKAIANLEKTTSPLVTINQTYLKSIGLGMALNLDLDLNAGLKFTYGVGASAAGYKVNPKIMVIALQSSKQNLIAAQGHYDQANLYNKLADTFIQKALELQPGEQQDKLLDRAERYHQKATDEMKVGDGTVKEAQDAFLKGIGFSAPTQPTPPTIPVEIPKPDHNKPNDKPKEEKAE